MLSGVTESHDDIGVIAYEVTKSAGIMKNFRDVLDGGYVKRNQHDEFAIDTWPGDFSVALRVRMWENADILNIYDWTIGHRFGIRAGGDGVFLKINGITSEVQVSNVNVSDGLFHRIHLSISGNNVLAKVSGFEALGCGDVKTTRLTTGTRDRTILISRSIVVLGGEGMSLIEVSGCF